MKKLCVIILIATNISIANCTSALSACNNYVKALESETAALRELNTKLKQQRDEAVENLEAEAPPIIPWYGWLVIGAASGVVADQLLKR